MKVAAHEFQRPQSALRMNGSGTLMYGGTRECPDWRRGERLRDQPTVFFTARFLASHANEQFGWSVDWSRAVCEECRRDPRPDCHEDDGGLAGVIIRSSTPEYEMQMFGETVGPQRIWRLTGAFDGEGEGFEGRWPD